MENSQRVCSDGNLGAECILLYVRVVWFHGRPFSGKDTQWFCMLPGSISKCQAVLSCGGLLEVVLCATEVSWFMTASDTDTEYVVEVTIFVSV